MNKHELPEACKQDAENTQVQICMSMDDNQQSQYSLNVRNRTLGSCLHTIDLTGLDKLRNDMASDVEIDYSQVKGMVISKSAPAESDYKVHRLSMNGFRASFSGKNLNFGLQSALELPYDKAEAFLSKFD